MNQPIPEASRRGGRIDGQSKLGSSMHNWRGMNAPLDDVMDVAATVKRNRATTLSPAISQKLLVLV
jgi:hypothetical protein